MKILSNKKYGGLVNEIKQLNEVIKKKTNFNYELIQEKLAYEDMIVMLQKENGTLSKELTELREKYKKISTAKGGLVRHINKLIKELEESNLKIADLKSDRYLIKKLPADKTKGKQEIKSRSADAIRNGEIIKRVKQ